MICVVFSVTSDINFYLCTFLCQIADNLNTDDLDIMNVAQLKALCKDQGLKVSGKKAILQERLREHFLKEAQPTTAVDEFDVMSDEDLRTSLGARELDTSGDRQEMLNRLREDIEFTQQIASATTGDSATGYKTISEALAAAAESHEGGTITEILADIKSKTEQVPKWVDVTIRRTRIPSSSVRHLCTNCLDKVLLIHFES